ncbi:hypothetical protein QZH41_005030 [Actinostola sp. cb2023]|nr:hypothetical protein QZH41_005030 [Actinostola sp. cb2023]
MAERNTNSNYGNRKSQVRKEDLYMMTALWMQESPWALKLATEGENLRVVGSVFVLPNDRVLSVDCSRRGDHTTVHGAIRPLIKYPDKVKGCQVYLTRKPCAHCVKMLVQAGVSKVFYLPLKPETDTKENKSVDALFQVSEVSRSFYVPQITQKHIQKLKTEKKQPPYGRNESDVEKQREGTDISTFEKYKKRQEWDKTWFDDIQEHLDWEEFGDEEIETEVLKDMDDAFKWFCQATFAVGKQGDGNIWKKYGEESNEFKQDVAAHLSRLAQMLSNRTDDPNRGVGCVMTIGEEIISIGWNGFPSKALYGNHPRGSESDIEAGQKYPHVIHAEQNALLCRNQRKLKGSIVYVNKIPCNDCMSMLYELGVRKVVLPYFKVPPSPAKKSETCFFKLVENPEMEVYGHQLTE